jgi:glycine betaine/proline transport system ATP-binding protein
MSMVFQSFALMPHLNIVDNTAFGLELAGVAREQRIPKALDALDQVGLAAWADSYPDELSGGMQQRVGLARALASNPAVMLMDEAFSALDPLIRTEMQDELLRLQTETRRTVIFISHDLDEAMRIGDRIAIMEGGRVVQVGTPEEILNDPADEYVRSFFRGVDVSTVFSAGDIAQRKQAIVIDREGVGVRTALNRLKEADRTFAYVVAGDLTYHGVVSVDTLREAQQRGENQIHAAYVPDVEPLAADTPVSDLIGDVARAPCGVPVVNAKGRYMGVISKALLLETLDRQGDTPDA